MKEVHYNTEGLLTDTISKNGELYYIENPIRDSPANIILKK